MNLPLTQKLFRQGAVFFHVKAPKIHYYLSPDFKTIHRNRDKSILCHVPEMSTNGFVGTAWHIDKIIKDAYPFSDFLVVEEPEREAV